MLLCKKEKKKTIDKKLTISPCACMERYWAFSAATSSKRVPSCFLIRSKTWKIDHHTWEMPTVLRIWKSPTKGNKPTTKSSTCFAWGELLVPFNAFAPRTNDSGSNHRATKTRCSDPLMANGTTCSGCWARLRLGRSREKGKEEPTVGAETAAC